MKNRHAFIASIAAVLGEDASKIRIDFSKIIVTNTGVIIPVTRPSDISISSNFVERVQEQLKNTTNVFANVSVIGNQ